MKSPTEFKGVFIHKDPVDMRKASNGLSQFLRDCRTKKGFSQTEVAEALGYETPQFISNWERGLAAPPMEALKELSDMYKVSSDQMFQMILETTIERVTINLKRRYLAKKQSNWE